jgi:hypothetical protein
MNKTYRVAAVQAEPGWRGQVTACDSREIGRRIGLGLAYRARLFRQRQQESARGDLQTEA